MPEITRILQSLEHGDARAADELLPLVYDELRRVAAHKMSLQPPGQTLQATALVHEAYLRLLGNEDKRTMFSARAWKTARAARALRICKPRPPSPTRSPTYPPIHKAGRR